MIELREDKLGEKIYKTTLSNGLPAFVIPKEGFQKTYAIYATNYGSVDRTFKTDKDKDFITVPDGIAHFLEHKLFESENGNAFDRYAKTGASANAFTSFDKTAYLFSCTDKFEESFEILLDFVQNPHFSKEGVEKEQGIIGQEIGMGLDDPDWRVLMNLFASLYHKGAVRSDIAGSKESIAEIDKDLLYRCHETFYNPSNMALCVVGDVDPQAVLELAEKNMKKTQTVTIERFEEDEPADAYKSYFEQSLAVSLPQFLLGFKLLGVPKSGEGLLKVKTAYEIIMSMLGSKAGSLYNRLYDAGLLTSNFSCEFASGRGFMAPLFGGESKDPKRVQAEILEEISGLKKNFDKEWFEACKRSLYSRSLYMYNHVELLGNSFIDSFFEGIDYFEIAKSYEKITDSEVEAFLKSAFSENAMTLSVISPK